jgi:uncharacterized protein YxjI
MRYVLKQKLFNLGGAYYIRDEAGRDFYLVEGKVFSFGHQLSFSDTSGNELAYIRQRLLSWGPTYEIYREGELFAVVKKELFTFFRHVFTVDVPGPDDLTAEGDFMDLEFTFTRSGQVVAVASRKWFSWADTYGLDIADGEDDVTILASAIVIDTVRADSHRR